MIEDCRFSIVVEIKGKQGNRYAQRNVSMVSEPFKDMFKRMPGATYISYLTGICAAIFAKNLSRIKEYGVFPTEYLSKNIRKNILHELKQNNIHISA